MGETRAMRNGLKAIRIRKRLTQKAAASLMEMSKSGYTKIEDGHRRLTDQYIRAAMVVFDATEAEVLGTAAPHDPPAVVTMRNLELTPKQELALARACVLFLQEAEDRPREAQWLEALVKIAQTHEADAEKPESLDLLRVKIRGLLSPGR